MRLYPLSVHRHHVHVYIFISVPAVSLLYRQNLVSVKTDCTVCTGPCICVWTGIGWGVTQLGTKGNRGGGVGVEGGDSSLSHSEISTCHPVSQAYRCSCIYLSWPLCVAICEFRYWDIELYLTGQLVKESQGSTVSCVWDLRLCA